MGCRLSRHITTEAGNWFFSNDCVTFCDDTEEAVRDAVDRTIRRAIPRQLIRETALERVKRERLAFFQVVDRIFAEHGQGSRRFEPEFRRMFFDKMNYCGRQVGDLLVP